MICSIRLCWYRNDIIPCWCILSCVIWISFTYCTVNITINLIIKSHPTTIQNISTAYYINALHLQNNPHFVTCINWIIECKLVNRLPNLDCFVQMHQKITKLNSKPRQESHAQTNIKVASQNCTKKKANNTSTIKSMKLTK